LDRKGHGNAVYEMLAHNYKRTSLQPEKFFDKFVGHAKIKQSNESKTSISNIL